jgi:proteasome lid subunit RPN8/RPN11
MVTIPYQIYQQLLELAQQGAPDEICGILGGYDDQVSCLIPIPNGATDPRDRYLMDAASMVRAILELRRAKLEVIALYHSHPREAAQPSATDIAEATWTDALYLIIGHEAGANVIRAWSIRGGAAREQAIHLVH